MNLDQYEPRLFTTDADVRHIGEGLLARTLPREQWTHEAHLAACLYLLTERPDVDIDGDIPTIISGYNESVGGVNDDTQGYHETITRIFVAAVRLFLRQTSETGLVERVNALLRSPMGKRSWPFRFYTAERLFSVEARRAFVQPNLSALPQICGAPDEPGWNAAEPQQF